MRLDFLSDIWNVIAAEKYRIRIKEVGDAQVLTVCLATLKPCDLFV